MYGVNVFLGYMLMLLAMTYSTTIFCMVIGGLTIGHGFFNWNAEVGETTDPCCSGQNSSRAASGAYTVPAEILAANSSIVLNVTGMTCMEGCGSTVQAALREAPGVDGAVVDIENSTATVWGESKLDVDALIGRVEAVGFFASVDSKKKSVHSPEYKA